MESELRQEVLTFRKARNWPATDTLENLTAALADEAGELSEYIAEPTTPEERQKLNHDIGLAAADVAIYLTALCEHRNIDLEQAIRDKMKILGTKYPTGLDRSALSLWRYGAYAANNLPIEHLLELWGDYDIADWNEVAQKVGELHKKVIFESWHWGAICDISRNLDCYDRKNISRVIESGIPPALEELLTYDLDLRQEEIDCIRETLKIQDC